MDKPTGYLSSTCTHAMPYCLNVLPVWQPVTASMFFQFSSQQLSQCSSSLQLSCDGLSSGSPFAGSLSSALFPFFPFLFFGLGLPVAYIRFESIVVARWRSTSMMPEGNAKEDTWKCTVRICCDYLIATANCNYIGT